jgi:Ribonuclease HII
MLRTDSSFLKEKELNFSYLVCGCDEAGRGCLAGSVFAAAVILPSDFHNQEINDSKKLSARQRQAARKIIEQNAIAFAIAECSNEEIDKINILRASCLAMERAIIQLNTKPDWLLIDGNRFYTKLDIPYNCVVHGDATFISIAAASILAKTYRDDYIEALSVQYPQYHWDKNKAYPTKEHRAAIRKFGISPLHRRTYNLYGQDTLF